MPELFRAARAATLVPGSAVINDAAILTSQGKILEVGKFSDLSRAFSGSVTDLGDVFLAPGLINAHNHLELAHLRGKTVADQGFVTWVEDLIRQPIYELDPIKLDQAFSELKRTGTVMVGDIATRFAKDMAGFLQESGLFFTVFTEAIGEKVPGKGFMPRGDFDRGGYSVAGHSLYTCHAQVLQAAKAETRAKGLPFSLHLAEHDDEVAIMAGEPSGFLDLLQARGRLRDFTAPGKRPVQQAHDLGLLDESTLAVHCVKLTDEDVRTVAESGASVCLCPRSNEFINVGRAPWEKLHQAGVNLCLGTDSLASNHDLNLWNEAEYLKQRFHGELSPEDLLAMMTRNPAGALGVDDRLGTLEPGKLAVWSHVPDWLWELFE
ncbi:amidohydrolase family protein [Pseudodesulfovibrio tunisiensis]|uniref:amidohydrolase family protein n=1 Tax=Pseudodesulfovibrio tunisiensis TaxID=463192 RepID=UPI001FB53F78|nr:amidohydrolase family protein [Pseudodesulfovibrio tunisiensis]